MTIRSGFFPIQFTLFYVALAAAGCAKPAQPKDAVPVFPVTGNLVYEGESMIGAVITFHSNERQLTAQGIADELGVYSLTTYLSNDGAAAGDYVVTIHWPSTPQAAPSAADPDPPLPPDRLKSTYTNGKSSKLRATVNKCPNSIDFELP
ncbi:hypothetical protein [Schlesneria paludicola]|uniref:hypothetical protein n=1 Tax=Schlesneria paludicola TaxID=360056 RepID=UPI00029A85D2|nr:hypothetical protein [Schlesneria paludicola]